jgi:hypothetical protein
VKVADAQTQGSFSVVDEREVHMKDRFIHPRRDHKSFRELLANRC